MELSKLVKDKWKAGASPFQITLIVQDAANRDSKSSKEIDNAYQVLVNHIEEHLPKELDWVNVPFILSEAFEMIRDGCKNVKIRNPKSKRCVKLSGVIGQKVLSDSKPSKAPLDQLLNPSKPRADSLVSESKIRAAIKKVVKRAKDAGGLLWFFVSYVLNFVHVFFQSYNAGDLWTVLVLMCLQTLNFQLMESYYQPNLFQHLDSITQPLGNMKSDLWINTLYFISKQVEVLGVPVTKPVQKAHAAYRWTWTVVTVIRATKYIYDNKNLMPILTHIAQKKIL